MRLLQDGRCAGCSCVLGDQHKEGCPEVDRYHQQFYQQNPMTLSTPYPEVAAGNRHGLLEGFAAMFMQETGLKASQCELVEERTPDGWRFYFRKRPELRTKEEAMAEVQERIQRRAERFRMDTGRPITGVEIRCNDCGWHTDVCIHLKQTAMRQKGCIHCGKPYPEAFTMAVRHPLMGHKADGEVGLLHDGCRDEFHKAQDAERGMCITAPPPILGTSTPMVRQEDGWYRPAQPNERPDALAQDLPASAIGAYDHNGKMPRWTGKYHESSGTPARVAMESTSAPSFICDRCHCWTEGGPVLVSGQSKYCGPCADEIDPSRKGP